jgi:hypothetical protein
VINENWPRSQQRSTVVESVSTVIDSYQQSSAVVNSGQQWSIVVDSE